MTGEKPTTLLQALLAVQAEATKVKKTATNPAFKSKYVTLEALMDTVLPILNRHGLVWVTMPILHGEVPALHYRLILANSGLAAPDSSAGTHFVPIGDAISGTMPLLIDKQNPQGLGSALTYARRQSLMAVVGIVGEDDDDGNRASQSRAKPVAQAAQEAAADLMSDAQLRNMWKALAEAEISDERKDLILAAQGIGQGSTDVTLDQGRKIRRRLDEAMAVTG